MSSCILLKFPGFYLHRKGLHLVKVSNVSSEMNWLIQPMQMLQHYSDEKYMPRLKQNLHLSWYTNFVRYFSSFSHLTITYDLRLNTLKFNSLLKITFDQSSTDKCNLSLHHLHYLDLSLYFVSCTFFYLFLQFNFLLYLPTQITIAKSFFLKNKSFSCAI